MLKNRTILGASLLALLASACSGGDTETASNETTSGSTEAAANDAPVAYASLTGDAASGKALFMQCRTCHVTDKGKNLIGPSLHNIVGAKAGGVSGFNYSPANASSGITWTEEKLFEYLADPKAVIPGTTMSYGGMPDAQQRADLIAYLKNPR